MAANLSVGTTLHLTVFEIRIHACVRIQEPCADESDFIMTQFRMETVPGSSRKETRTSVVLENSLLGGQAGVECPRERVVDNSFGHILKVAYVVYKTSIWVELAIAIDIIACRPHWGVLV